MFDEEYPLHIWVHPTTFVELREVVQAEPWAGGPHIISEIPTVLGRMRSKYLVNKRISKSYYL
jgi:hypothetical protein